MTLLALGDEPFGIGELIQNAIGSRPLAEQMVVLEEVVMAEGCMSDDERLHCHRVLLHHVRNARIRIDDQLISQRLAPLRYSSSSRANCFPNDQCEYISGMPVAA